MRKLSVLGLAIAFVVGARADASDDTFEQHQAIVRLHDAADPNAFLALLTPSFPGISISRQIASRNVLMLSIPPQFNEDEVEIALTAMVNPVPGFDPTRPLRWAELNYEGRAPEGRTGTIWVTRAQYDSTQYTSQYIGQQIGIAQSQARSTGRGAVVALLDTGVDATHPLLAGVVRSDGRNFLNPATPNDTRDIGDGLDNDQDGVIDEGVGHGTFMAGLIHLLAPQAQILPVVVIDSDGVGDMFAWAEGVFFAIDHGVEVINMSLSSTYNSDLLKDALLEARQRGIIAVAAAGNQNRVQREFPAMSVYHDNLQDLPLAIGVASIDHAGIKAAFSNFNSRLAICAPGTSTIIAGEPVVSEAIFSLLPGDRVGVWEGTSVSTALVSGAAAAVRAQYPSLDATPATADFIRNVLTSTSADVYALNPQYGPPIASAPQLGSGLLAADAATLSGPPMPALADLNGDGVVDSLDLGIMLRDWALIHSIADLNGDGVVSEADLGIMLREWQGP
ncbi:MAG: S8 family serine peptidase [Phycisphaerae bacterium]